ncbi:MAG: hypothetical protein WBB22_11810 [Anaerolineae bacterium]
MGLITALSLAAALIIGRGRTLPICGPAYLTRPGPEGFAFWPADVVLYEAVRDRLSWVRWIGDYH